MASIAETAAQVFRQFVTDGVPASGANKPSKTEIQALFTTIANAIAASTQGMQSYATSADLPTDPAPADGTQARVYADDTDTNNGVWIYKGGAWAFDSDYYDAVATVVQPLVDEAAASAASIAGLIKEASPTVIRYLTTADESGYAGGFFAEGSEETARFGTEEAAVTPRGLELTSYNASDPVFAVIDEYGYAAVFVGPGQTLIVGSDNSETISDGAAPQRAPMPKTRVYPHRGVTLNGAAPEESRHAYILTARAGFEYGDGDIQKTSDGVYVLCHDPTINRTFYTADPYAPISGTVTIADTTWAVLSGDYVMASSDPRKRTAILRLEEALALYRDLGLRPTWELKHDVGLTTDDVDAIYALMVRYLGKGGFELSSFTTSLIDYARTLDADLPLTYIVPINSTNIDMAVSKSAALADDYSNLTDELMAEARTKGVRVDEYTVPNDAFDSMVKLGVDGMWSDTIAPPLDKQAVAFTTFADGAFADFTTTGTINNGVLSLTEGETLTLNTDLLPNAAFGAYYLNVDLIGTASISAPNLAVTPPSNAGPSFVAFAYQSLIYGQLPTLVITGGSGGCTIGDLSYSLAKF